MSDLLLPTFQEMSFRFKDEVPPHIEDYPSVPSRLGLYAVFGAANGTKHYPLAVDIEGLELAELLAQAREREQKKTFKLYGYTDDVYIANPDGSLRRTYYGRTR